MKPETAYPKKGVVAALLASVLTLGGTVAKAQDDKGGGIGRVLKVGNQPINSRIEAYYNAVRPDGAPDWQISFTWQFLFPK